MPVAISPPSLREAFAPDGWRILMLVPHPDDFDAVADTTPPTGRKSPHCCAS